MVDARPIDHEIARLVAGNRWAALGTVAAGAPAVSMVAYAPEPAMRALLLFLSGLSSHTQNLRADPRASIAISAPDPGAGDPQELARVTLGGIAVPLARESPEFAELWPRYLDRFPAAARTVMLPDFTLFRMEVRSGRYVGGFARAVDLDPARLSAAALAAGSN
jgi:putative heme iron utilization protein